MMVALHKLARTTPAVRAEIALSTESASALAERYGISVATVYKWRSRDDFNDRSHTAHCLQTTLTPAQEAIVVALRRVSRYVVNLPLKGQDKTPASFHLGRRIRTCSCTSVASSPGCD